MLHIPRDKLGLIILYCAVACTASAVHAQSTPTDQSDRMVRLARSQVERLEGEKPVFDESQPLIGRPAGAGNRADEAGERSAGGWLNTITALGVVVGLVFLVRAGLMRMAGRTSGGGRSTSAVEVLSRVSVGPRHGVLLLRVGGRVLVVGESSGNLNTLTEVTDPDEVASLLAKSVASERSSISTSFNQMLNRFGSDLDESEHGSNPSEVATDRARDQVLGLLSHVRTLAREKVA